MRCVTSGATSAWNRPPIPMLPNLWIRSSNQYGAPCGLRAAGDCRSYAAALDGEAKLAGFTTTPIVVGVSGLIGLEAPLFVGLSMLPSASGEQRRRRRCVALSGMSVLDGVGLAIEQAHYTCVWPDGLTKRFPPAPFPCLYLESSLILMIANTSNVFWTDVTDFTIL